MKQGPTDKSRQSYLKLNLKNKSTKSIVGEFRTVWQGKYFHIVNIFQTRIDKAVHLNISNVISY